MCLYLILNVINKSWTNSFTFIFIICPLILLSITNHASSHVVDQYIQSINDMNFQWRAGAKLQGAIGRGRSMRGAVLVLRPSCPSPGIVLCSSALYQSTSPECWACSHFGQQPWVGCGSLDQGLHLLEFRVFAVPHQHEKHRLTGGDESSRLPETLNRNREMPYWIIEFSSVYRSSSDLADTQQRFVNPFTPDLKKCILPTFQKAIVWVM